MPPFWYRPKRYKAARSLGGFSYVNYVTLYRYDHRSLYMQGWEDLPHNSESGKNIIILMWERRSS